jgi:hypothetical protein
MEYITKFDSLLFNAAVLNVEQKEKNVSSSLHIPNSAVR